MANCETFWNTILSSINLFISDELLIIMYVISKNYLHVIFSMNRDLNYHSFVVTDANQVFLKDLSQVMLIDKVKKFFMYSSVGSLEG